MSSTEPGPNAAPHSAHTPPGYGVRPLHIALILTDLLGRIHPLILTPAWLALAAIACWPWTSLRPAAAALSLAFTLADGVSLALLPRLGRSFGPVTPSLLALTLVRTALTFAAGLLWAVWPGLLLTGLLQLAIAAALLYGTWIEPFRVEVTQAELHSPKLSGHAPLRLLHISDLHVERITPRERALLRMVEETAADVVVLTGDYLNLAYVYDAEAQAEAHDLLARLCDIARGPVYAVTGSPPVDRSDVVPAIFEDLPINWLLDAVEELHINGHSIRIAGLRCTRERHLDAPRLRHMLDGNSGHEFTLLLYHSPDLMPEAVELGVDLYLCGHTHGGQIRLPLIGALITSSDFWKRYEMGRYEEGRTTLYVSRGLGMEGLGAPRARFLAPPEIVLWTLDSWASCSQSIQAEDPQGGGTMATIERSVLIQAPPERIFAFLADHANDTQWLPGMVDARNFTGESTDYRWEWTYKMAGISLDGTGQVLEYDPPRRHVVETRGGVVSIWAWTLEPEGDATRVSLRMEYTVPLAALGKLAEKLLLGQNEKAADQGMANLQRILEEG